MITVKAKFPQHWRNNKYDKDQEMPANKEQARRLTKAGVAYYSVESETKEPENTDESSQNDFSSVPAGDVLKKYYKTVNAVSFASDKELLSKDGIGEKTLEKIRAYFG